MATRFDLYERIMAHLVGRDLTRVRQYLIKNFRVAEFRLLTVEQCAQVLAALESGEIQ